MEMVDETKAHEGGVDEPMDWEDILPDVIVPDPVAVPVSTPRFRMDRVIGEGGFGQVCRAFDRIGGTSVAVKQVTDGDAEHELTILKRVQGCANVIKLVDGVRDASKTLLVMELMCAGNLRQVYGQNQLDVSAVKCIVQQILKAIHFVHSNNVVHMDLKPDNILLNHIGTVKVCDFGLAVYGRINQCESVSATVQYTAPEVFEQSRCSYKVDIWAIGCIFGELLQKYPIFETRNSQVKMMKNMRLHFRTFESILSSYGYNLLLGMLNRNPKYRFCAQDSLRDNWFCELPLPNSCSIFQKRSYSCCSSRFTQFRDVELPEDL